MKLNTGSYCMKRLCSSYSIYFFFSWHQKHAQDFRLSVQKKKESLISVFIEISVFLLTKILTINFDFKRRRTIHTVTFHKNS